MLLTQNSINTLEVLQLLLTYQTIEAVIKEKQQDCLFMQRIFTVIFNQRCFQYAFEKEGKVFWLFFECLGEEEEVDFEIISIFIHVT